MCLILSIWATVKKKYEKSHYILREKSLCSSKQLRAVSDVDDLKLQVSPIRTSSYYQS